MTVTNMKKSDYDCSVKIRQLRKKTGFTQLQFCGYFRIPHKTLQNWEGRIASPPEYLIDLIEYKLKKENLIWLIKFN